MKYVLVTGGVISGVGKGIIAPSTGLLLKAMGLTVAMIKIDPYMNVDAGTMAPTEHGEVFVLSDGGEADLDLGNYERYPNINLSRDHKHHHRQDLPALRVAKVPVDETGSEPQVCVIELGGTVGDIENMPFVNALGQLRMQAGAGNFLHTHVSFISLAVNDEQKDEAYSNTPSRRFGARDCTPTWYVLFWGRLPSVANTKFEKSIVEKVARSCQVSPLHVIAVHDVKSKPTWFLHCWRDKVSCGPWRMYLDSEPPSTGSKMWETWKTTTTPVDHEQVVSIALLRIKMVDSSNLEPSNASSAVYTGGMARCQDRRGVILVPGGFGQRGTEGMMLAIKWARENQGSLPGHLPWACNSPPIEICPAQIDHTKMGGTMRLSLRATHFRPESGERMGILELKDHPWFVAVQFHPEYVSKVLHPSRPILGFFAASGGFLGRIAGRDS
ncbi:uncharacterized protein PpBr36_10755 [Pyricularia pennisetigena]|uniref:uncharacterized protein n=1 Tax=Pyricularia pennisetigena TaxID=1578925 RepID=UPI001153EE64|nr:uncharacterized protein PpBr36_10755 [Pyricularia pennisetigena]TLS20885.1 hypothetical protein PpBr36_10755 [Pyricularia pennisetigena]